MDLSEKLPKHANLALLHLVEAEYYLERLEKNNFLVFEKELLEALVLEENLLEPFVFEEKLLEPLVFEKSC